MNPTIRPERAGDADTIREVVRAAFAGYPHSDGSEPAIVERLRAAGGLAISLVAEERREIVGHVAFSPVTIDGAEVAWLGLGPVSVVPHRQGAGIGSALIRQGLDQAREGGARGVVLLGDPGYYRRFGFARAPGLRYPPAPPEYFQALSFTGELPKGEVRYAPAFG